MVAKGLFYGTLVMLLWIGLWWFIGDTIYDFGFKMGQVSSCDTPQP